MLHLTNEELKQRILIFLTNYIKNFWKGIEFFKTPEEAMLRYHDVFHTQMMQELKEREIFNEVEYSLLVGLTEILVYITNTNIVKPTWKKLTKDEEKAIYHLFELVKKELLN